MTLSLLSERSYGSYDVTAEAGGSVGRGLWLAAATLRAVRTLLADPLPTEIEAMLERRRHLGLDRKDEVWEGVLHVVRAPSGEHAQLAAQVLVVIDPLARAAGLTPTTDFNLGGSESDFRVPDGGLHRSPPHGVWQQSAALVLEILLPEDDTSQKLPFYAAHHVEEVLIVDPDAQSCRWLALVDGDYEPVEQSRLIELGRAKLTKLIRWP